MNRIALRTLLLTLVALSACTKAEDPASALKVASTEAGALELSLDDGLTSGDDSQPTLTITGAADPRAVAVCDALIGMPTDRRAACCSERSAQASDVEQQCGVVMSALLERQRVRLSEQKLQACVNDQKVAHETCDWVRPLPAARAASCADLFDGVLDTGSRCKSSLECKDGLRCHGASALADGRCGAPKADRMPCGATIDPATVALGITVIDAAHPECEGQCVLGRCAPKHKPKATNTAVAMWRAKSGDTCRHDLDCVEGGCVKADRGAATGVCAMKCRAL